VDIPQTGFELFFGFTPRPWLPLGSISLSRSQRPCRLYEELGPSSQGGFSFLQARYVAPLMLQLESWARVVVCVVMPALTNQW
jgi:hypothetical protein